MNCPFCSKEMMPSNYYTPEPGIVNHYCNAHPYEVQVLATKDDKYYVATYRVWQNQHEYRVETGQFPNGDWWLLKDGSQIIRLDFLPPHLTPETIEKHFKTLLVFS